MNAKPILPTFAVIFALTLFTSGVLAKPSSKDQRLAPNVERMQRPNRPEQTRNIKTSDDEPDRIYDIGSGNFIDNPDKHPGNIEH
jgi:hypothetical protein